MAHVHIVPGESAAGALSTALGDGDGHLVVGLRDSLSCGPLPSTSSLLEWTQARQRFWAEVLNEHPLQRDGLLPDPASFRMAETVTIWLGNGLGDQLALPWMCWLLDLLAIPSAGVHVVQFPLNFARGHRTPSLGMLSPELIRHHPSARPLGADEANDLRMVWSAVTASDPTALSAIVAQRRHSHLCECLARLAWRYPHSVTGVNYWERALLENVQQHGPKAAHVIGHTLAGPGWDTDPIGDGWLLWRLRRLSALPVPLVRLLGEVNTLHGTKVELLPAGKEVLGGAKTLLDINPIDEWVGGVHLDSRTGGTWVTSAGPELDATPLPNCGLQLTWRSLTLAPRS